MISTTDPLELARMATERPRDFGYWGRDEMFDTWGFAGVDQHRDSDVLDRSNFEVISRDLLERFPDDFDVECMGHWAVGHVDRMTVRVFEDDRVTVTPAFLAAMEWHETLEGYPVASDDHYSELETEEFHRDVENFAGDCLPTGEALRGGLPTDWAWDVVSALSETCSRFEDCRATDVADVLRDLGYVVTV